MVLSNYLHNGSLLHCRSQILQYHELLCITAEVETISSDVILLPNYIHDTFPNSIGLSLYSTNYIGVVFAPSP